MLDFYNAYKEKILQFILYRFQRSIGIIIQNFKNLDHFKKIYISRYMHHLKVNQNLKLLNYSSYSL